MKIDSRYIIIGFFVLIFVFSLIGILVEAIPNNIPTPPVDCNKVPDTNPFCNPSFICDKTSKPPFCQDLNETNPKYYKAEFVGFATETLEVNNPIFNQTHLPIIICLDGECWDSFQNFGALRDKKANKIKVYDLKEIPKPRKLLR